MAPTFVSYCVFTDMGPLNRHLLRLKGADERMCDSKSVTRGKSYSSFLPQQTIEGTSSVLFMLMCSFGGDM